MYNKSFNLSRSVLIIFIVISHGCAKQNHEFQDLKSSTDFTLQEFCYINNKVLSYILESNDMFFDSEFFTRLKFDKNKSSILYQKMNDSILQENLKFIIDRIDNHSLKLVKNKIDVLNVCNSTQMSVHFIDQNNLKNDLKLSATSKYKCLFSISDVAQIGDEYYIFCEYSEYFNRIEEIEISKLGFQFTKCQNNGFIKFDKFLEWHDEMFGHQDVELFAIYNDSIILNQNNMSDLYHSKAGFFIKEIISFECE